MPNYARFTPSIHDGPTLEKLFVVREPLLEDALERIRDASESGRLAHALFTGPRGSGKTHLISLIHYRATQLPGYGTAFSLAWLEEDPYAIHSFETLIEQIDAANEHPEAPLTVVFAEGFDRILKSLGPEGQRRFRARIERDGNLLLIASSTRLTDSILKQSRPFHGSFDHIELHPFSMDEAILMLKRAAEFDEDLALVARLDEPDVRARLSAIAQLAGGQPRLWALLSAGLTVSSIDDMVSLLITKFDDLTPYYQALLDSLSATELQIVWQFIGSDRAMTTKEVAQRSGISQQTVASTIKRLRPAWLVPREGLLQSFVDKRLTYYQLAEPLLRVGPQLKQTRGRPIALVADFLSAWFSRSDLMAFERPSDGRMNVPEVVGRSDRETFADCEPEEPVESFSVSGGVVGTAAQALAVAYRRAAVRRAEQSEAQMHQRWVSPWPDDLSTYRYPQPTNGAVVSEACRVDDALSVLQHRRSATAVLELPVALASLVEDRLADTSVGLMRLEIALVAVRAGGGDEWLGRALDALQGVRPEEERLAQIAVACLRFLLGQADAAVRTLEMAFSAGEPELAPEEWRIIASTLCQSSAPLKSADRASLTASVASHVADDNLPAFLAMVCEWEIRSVEERQEVLALCDRLSSEPFSGEPTYPVLRSIVKDHAPAGSTEWLLPLALLAWHQSRYENDPEGAIKDLEAYVAAAAISPDFDEASLLEIRSAWARTKAALGATDEAVVELRSIVAEARERLSEYDFRMDDFLSDLAVVLREAGDPEAGIALLRDRAAWSAGAYGPGRSQTLYAIHNLGYALHEAGHIDEALSVDIELSEQARQVLPAGDWVRRSCWWGIHNFCGKTQDHGLAIRALRCLLSEDLPAMGGQRCESALRRALVSKELVYAKDLASSGHVDDAIRELRATVEWTKSRGTDNIDVRTELADVLERTGEADFVSEANEIRATVLNDQAEALLGRWRRQLNSAPDTVADKREKASAAEPGPMPQSLRLVVEPKASTEKGFDGHVLRLDETFLKEVGLNHIPVDQKQALQSIVYSELETRVGEGLTQGVTDAKLDEFGLFVDKDEPGMRAWLDENDPGFADRAAYKQWAKENPQSSESDLMSDYGAMLWLTINRPDHRDVVRKVTDQLKRELMLVRDQILAACGA